MLAALGLALISLGGNAVEVYETFPEAIDPSERYVIYSHGFIVEGSDPRPTVARLVGAPEGMDS